MRAECLHADGELNRDHSPIAFPFTLAPKTTKAHTENHAEHPTQTQTVDPPLSCSWLDGPRVSQLNQFDVAHFLQIQNGVGCEKREKAEKTTHVSGWTVRVSLLALCPLCESDHVPAQFLTPSGSFLRAAWDFRSPSDSLQEKSREKEKRVSVFVRRAGGGE